MGIATFDTQLLTAATALDTASPIQEDRRSSRLRFYADWDGATTAGAVVIEASPTPDFTRSVVLHTFTQAANTGQTATLDGPLGYYRARVSVAVVGGAASAWALGIE